MVYYSEALVVKEVIKVRPDQDEFFTSLYREYFNQIKLYALSFVSDSYRAEEIAQDTFHTAMEKIDDLIKADEPIRWLKRTAKNKMRNEQRTRQRYLKRYLSLDNPDTPEAPSADSVEDTVLEEDDRRQKVSVAETIQQTLTPTEITILKRIALEHAHYSEVAQELGISLWDCQKRMQRIRHKLEEKFPQYKNKKKFKK